MNELVVIVEGETEQAFVRNVLAGHLALRGTTVWAVLPGKQRRHGGARKWEVARQDICRTLRERRYCTTMFDYYGLPNDWPGRATSRAQSPHVRASCVEAEVASDVAAAMGDAFNPKFFIPYIQLHEFEALAFADVEILASVTQPIASHSVEWLVEHFRAILFEAGNPEAINDSYDTCPSRRIARAVPAYRKRTQSPIVTSRIGLGTLRERCGHFASWLDRLEGI